MFKMTRSKRGDVSPANVVVSMVIVLIIAIILLTIIGKFFPGILSLKSCSDRGGTCRQGGFGSGCSDTEFRIYGATGCQAEQICCTPIEAKVGEEKVSQTQRVALDNAIILTVDKDTTPKQKSTPIPLKVGVPYKFNIQLNDKLPERYRNDYSLCAVYLTNSKETGKKYLLPSQTDFSLIPANNISDANSNINLEIMPCKNVINKYFTPSFLDSYMDLSLYIILFDENLTGAAWLDKNIKNKDADVSFKGYAKVIGIDDKDLTSFTNNVRDQFSAMYSNTAHWKAFRVNSLKIDPLVKISGVNPSWSARNDVTITCSGVTCQNIGLSLVRMPSTDYNGYVKMYDECKGKASSDFIYSTDYITGVTTKTSGLPLNLNIGGFRIPTQKQEVQYLTQQKLISVVSNRAVAIIDRATMIKDFYPKSHNDAELFIGEQTYLCAKAKLSDGTEIYTLSEQPIKIDVLPPRVDQTTGIQVIYPDPDYGTLPGANLRTTPYYYRQYPRVVVTCDDYGQSGCASYDYYVKTGNFIDLHLNTNDLETAIKATLITEGLNALMQYFAQQDPLNTICPFILSDEYRRNSYPEIRFMSQGQGIMCIRVTDQAGNQALVWKSLWTPDSMFQRIALNTTSAILNK
jgi:hypothetical protein